MYICICKLESQPHFLFGTYIEFRENKFDNITSYSSVARSGDTFRLYPGKVSARFGPNVARAMKEKNDVGFFLYFLPRIWIMKRGFAAKKIVDEQLSEAETSSFACG